MKKIQAKWGDDKIGKTFRDKRTGEIFRFIGRCDYPCVTLEGERGNRVHFGIGALLDYDYEEVKE